MRNDKFFPVMRFMDPDKFFDGFDFDMMPTFFGDSSNFNARVDLYRKDGKIFVEAELPGIDPNDVDLHVYSDRVTLSAEKKFDSNESDKSKSYHRTERRWGKIERVIGFPVEADPESAKANFKNGVLTVEINEKSQDKAHKKLTITTEQ